RPGERAEMTSPGETSERHDNFDQVWRIYGFDEKLADLAPVMARSASERDWLLRHHSVAKMTNRDEIRLRATLDALLHGCGVLEAGFRAGALAAGQAFLKASLS